MKKYTLLDIKNQISQLTLTEADKDKHTTYLRSIIDRGIIEPFPDWLNITKIYKYAFAQCQEITSLIIPDYIVEIGDGAFDNILYLTNIIMGNGVKIIGSAAFRRCHSLVNITIPDSVTRINAMAFDYCQNLTNATIGSGVIFIGGAVFDRCPNLTDIYLRSSIPPQLAYTSAFGDSCTFHVPIGSEETYKSATNWSTFADRIVGDVVLEESTKSEEG